MLATMFEAVDLDACTSRWGLCRCAMCAVCGFGKHTAVHGPYSRGGELINKPWGHPFVPRGLVFVFRDNHVFQGPGGQWELEAGTRSVRFYEKGKEVWVEFEGGVTLLLSDVVEMVGESLEVSGEDSSN